MAEALERGREAYARRAWADAYAHLSDAGATAPLEADDLERLARTAYLLGKDAESADLWSRAHHAWLDREEPEHAARCAFWLAFGLFNRREAVRAGGWVARAQRVLEDGRCDSVVQGYLLIPLAIQRVGQGNAAGAHETFCQAHAIGRRFRDPDLIALARCGSGRALIRLGRTAEGLALLDEAMVAATCGELSPIVTGDVYCTVIEGCRETLDLPRAREWTAALSDWCAGQPDLVPYRGQCLIYRAEVLRLRGAWTDAAAEAQRACERLSDPPRAAIGAAFYLRGELHRLRGAFGEAEDAYRRASRGGRKPQPGLSLLRLAEQRIDDAAAAIRHALEEAREPAARSDVLAAYVEIMLAAGDLTEARAAVGELSAIAAALHAPFLTAVLAHANGAVLLAEGDDRAALTTLRQASTAWAEVDAPYEGARTRVLTAIACRRLGDQDGADLELDAARQVFERLGARPDVDRVEALSRAAPAARTGGLTTRELQVLRLLATGKTNRAIAGALSISEKTVARHVSNIFDKLDLPSRAAATAYAYRHRLI